MVDCYRVADFKVESGDSRLWVAVQTRTLGARNTNIHGVLSTVGTITADPLSRTPPWETHGAAFTLAGASAPDVRELLRAHQTPTVTVITDADLSVCLDFYSHPPTESHGWKQTPTGELINRAKYGNSESAAVRLIQSAVAYVRNHAVLRRAEHVAAVPSSTVPGSALQDTLQAKLLAALVEAFGMTAIRLTRIKPRGTKQKNLPADSDRTAHQRETLAVHQPGSGSVLIIDDVMEYGDSINEAVRAVRAAGFQEAFSLCLAKDVKGTTRYSFEAE